MSNVVPFPGRDRPGPATPAPPLPQSTVDVFWYLIRLGDRKRLKDWLRQHREDAKALLQLLLSDQ